MFIVFITHSDELFEFMRISQDDIENGDKIDVINEEDSLDLQIHFAQNYGSYQWSNAVETNHFCNLNYLICIRRNSPAQ